MIFSTFVYWVFHPNNFCAFFEEAITQAAIESTEYHKKVWNESIENAVKEAKAMGVNFYYPDTKPFQEAVMPLHEEFKENPEKKIMYDKIRNKVN